MVSPLAAVKGPLLRRQDWPRRTTLSFGAVLEEEWSPSLPHWLIASSNSVVLNPNCTLKLPTGLKKNKNKTDAWSYPRPDWISLGRDLGAGAVYKHQWWFWRAVSTRTAADVAMIRLSTRWRQSTSWKGSANQTPFSDFTAAATPIYVM